MADTTFTGDATTLDGTASAAGTAAVNIIGGIYNDSIADIGSGNAGALRATSDRALHVNLRSASGVELVTGVQYVENAAIPADAGQGTLIIGRRDDALSTLTPVEGDAIGLRVNNRGALWIAHDGSLAVTGTFWQATQPVSGTVAVSGSVAVTGTFWQATQPVSGTFWQATQPVSISGNQAVNLTQIAGTATVTAGIAGVQAIGGPAAADAVISTNYPLIMGGRVSAVVPTAMSADNDVGYAWLDRAGRQIIAQKAGTSAVTTVASSATNVTLLAANTGRLGATVYNDSTAILYLKLGATASTSSFTVKMVADAYFEVPFGYAGIIDGIWASATGSARATELT